MTRNQGGVLIKQFEKTDYLVIPEFYGLDIADFEPGIPKIIFNQGAYLTFGGYSLDKNDLNTPYLSNEVIAAMVISQDSYEYLTYVFPQLNLVRLYNGIDSGMFKYTSEKKKQIAFMPRKLPKEITQVINILKYRGALQGFELVAIANKDEEEVAKILQESLIFLSTGTQEGFSLPPAEAMACGCIVVGYHGNGGKEFFKEEFCYPIQATDIITFAKTVESVIHEYEKDQTPILRKGQKASEFIKKTYSLHKEEEAIVGFWERICGIPS